MLLGDPRRRPDQLEVGLDHRRARGAGPPDRARRAAIAPARRPGPGRFARPIGFAGPTCLPRPRAPAPSARAAAPAPRDRAARTTTTRHASTAVSRRPERSDSAPIGRSRYSRLDDPRRPRSAAGDLRRRDRERSRAGARGQAARSGPAREPASGTRVRPRRRRPRKADTRAEPTPRPSGCRPARARAHRRAANTIAIASSAPVALGRQFEHDDREHGSEPEDRAPGRRGPGRGSRAARAGRTGR